MTDSSNQSGMAVCGKCGTPLSDGSKQHRTCAKCRRKKAGKLRAVVTTGAGAITMGMAALVKSGKLKDLAESVLKRL